MSFSFSENSPAPAEITDPKTMMLSAQIMTAIAAALLTIAEDTFSFAQLLFRITQLF